MSEDEILRIAENSGEWMRILSSEEIKEV